MRFFTYIHSQLLFYLEKFPKLQEEIDNKLKEFITQPNSRFKDNTPNLGTLMAYLLCSNKYKFADVIEPYFEE